MKKFFSSHLAVGLLLTIVTLTAFLFHLGIFESLELKTYDLRALLRQNDRPNQEIVIVAIDDDSIARLGRWPWPRTLLAEGIQSISNAGASVIGLNILLTEPERNQGLAEIRALKETMAPMLERAPEARDQLLSEFSIAEARLDSDTRLAETLKTAGAVVLPMYFTPGASLGNEDPVLSSHTLTQIESGTAFYPVEGHSPAVPLPLFSGLVSAVGHANVIPDADGVVRSEIPVIQFQGDYYPSFAVQLARAFLRVPVESLTLVPGRSLAIGRSSMPVNENGRTLINFNGPAGTFHYYSFFDVLNNKVDPAALKNRIVLIGHMATGIADLNVTPLGHNFPGVEITATVIQNILYRNYITRPPWAFAAELGAIVFAGLFIALLLPRLKAFAGAAVSLLLFLSVAAAGVYLFFAYGYWIRIFYPSFLLLSGYLFVTSRRFLVTERSKELVEAGAIETNKMLGLSFQGQGMLDLAFEKFRKCPLDGTMKELLYNLGLDFERKRQFNKAAAVYEYIGTVDGSYKDVPQKIAQLKAAADGAVFGGIGAKKPSAEGTVILEGSSAVTPTLGRYEIVKELGRGAMGTVYLGKDPKINRMVAIKTLRFEDEVDEASVKAVKERFFREAESAGNLNHPNIIKIYDAGEDNEVAYIAMELLEGEDLKNHAGREKLFPPATVLDYMIKIADALDYAHRQGVIHRDIKPANIMLIKDGTLRITDFGIARITASSKTQTGTVLGTPSYMSPEQLSGKKVDGRSDLFSFGAMLFELLTGDKPFNGDSIAELLFKISNEKHPDIRSLNPSLPEPLSSIIDKLLAKNPEERYQTGQDIVNDLKECLRNISE